MARYIGPKTKIARKFGDPIFGPDKYLQKKNYPPGQHGVSKRRGKKSEYAIQLSEKQKAKYTYGILEKQFSNLFKKASKSKMVTGEALLVFCESRLDNTVFRFGLSNTRSGARQLVSHGHIVVNKQQVTIASFQCRPGDIIEVREKESSKQLVEKSLSQKKKKYLPSHLSVNYNNSNFAGYVNKRVLRKDINLPINELLIVEYYARR